MSILCGHVRTSQGIYLKAWYMRMLSPFDAEAGKYDQWFESGRGQKIFEIEKDCLKRLFETGSDLWLEVGVGSGRFATTFGITSGVDPSCRMLGLARDRGIRVFCGVGEDLPCRDNTFDGILMVTTICFLADPVRTISECHRSLRPNGKLVVGIVPAESLWGRLYTDKGREGHPLYSRARFYTCRQIIEMGEATGFVFEQAASCLLNKPEDDPLAEHAEGANEAAGFAAMRFRK